MTETLDQIYQRNKRTYKGLEWPDKGSVHSYIEVYSEILAPYRLKAGRVLEIGLMSGESLRMWEQYFINSKVYGIDCSETPHDGLADLRPMIAEGTHNIFIIDATNKAEVDKHFHGLKFDIILEDAGHEVNQQLTIYKNFKKYLAKGGLYIIEDVQDINKDRARFEAIGGEVIDRRKIKNRYDDCLIVIR